MVVDMSPLLQHRKLVFLVVIYLFPTWQVCGTNESTRVPQICNMEVNYNEEKQTMYYIDSTLFSISKYVKSGDSAHNLLWSLYTVTQSKHVYHNCRSVNAQLQRSNGTEHRDRLLVALTSPCSIIYFKSRNPVVAKWLIKVYNMFMVNVTIDSAYIPYSDKCRLHDIEVHDGLNVTGHSMIDHYCGVISGEVAYTQYNRAMVQLQLSTVVQQIQVHMIVQYQIHMQNVAYRFHDVEQFCVPNWLHVNILPSTIEFTNGLLRYIWYLSSSVLYSVDHITKDKIYNEPNIYGKINVSQPLLIQYDLNVSTFECQNNSSYLEIYRGLLPASWYMWATAPQTVIHCGDTTVIYKLDFHLYFTVILHLNSLAFNHIKFNLAMNYKDQPIPNIGTELKLYGRSTIKGGNLHKVQHMSKGMVDFQYTSLRFVSLEADFTRSITVVNRMIHAAEYNVMRPKMFETYGIIRGESERLFP